MRRVRYILLAPLAAAALSAGCRSSIDAFASNPAEAARVADQAFAAFAYRFYNVQRDQMFDRARQRMGRYALVPSRLFNDTSVWTIAAGRDSSRALFVRAAYAGARYTFNAASSAPYPDQLGEQRHFLRLTSLGGNDYEWYTTVDHAIGHVKPAAVAAVIVAALTAAEGRRGDAALADTRRTFPATARHLGQLFDLDSLVTRQHDDGSTSATLGFTVRSDRLRARYPHFAAWLDRYIVPAIYRMRLTDARGATFLDLAGHDQGRIVARLRSRDHRLVSLEAGAPMPDSMRLHLDASAKYRLFRLGFRDLVGDFIIERGQHLRAWQLRFRREPRWQLPLAFDRLIRNPLRRPFQGNGIEMFLGVRDDIGPQTLSVRYSRLVVNESAIMRWLGNLGATAFGEFSGRTEQEENFFLYQLFAALRDDVRMAASGDIFSK